MKKLSHNALNDAILTAFERTGRAAKCAATVERCANVACATESGSRKRWTWFYRIVRRHKAIGAAT